MYDFLINNQSTVVIYLIILLILLMFVLFLKEGRLKKELNMLKIQLEKTRTKKDVKKDMERVKESLYALDVLFEEDLLPDKFYSKCKDKLSEAMDVLKERL